jgi:hypothetical protein
MKIIDLIVESKNESAAVADLKKGLLAAKKRGVKMDYDGVAEVMEKVWTKHNMSGQKLHDIFVEETGLIPDTWIKKQKPVGENLNYLVGTEKVDNVSKVLSSKSKNKRSQ